ncbi:MAG: GHKL domain-containing protein [Gammaproteobacteria bacterium]|nr:GHKL domain-containing protein [Gammaproteobacteria bacterium]
MSFFALTQNLSISKKFSLPSFLYAFGLVVIGTTVWFFYTGFRDSNELITDLVKQKSRLSELSSNLAKMNDDLVQLLYLKQQDRDGDILARAETLQSILVEFKFLAEKHDFINDRSLAEEIEPSIDELRLHLIRIVGLTLNKDRLGARTLYEKNYLPGAGQVMLFSSEALYGKSEQIDALYRRIQRREVQFLIVLLTEFVSILMIIYLLHKQLAIQLIKPINQLHAATRAIVKHYRVGGDEDYFNTAISLLKKIKTGDEIGLLSKNFRGMIATIEKGTADIEATNQKLTNTNGALIDAQKQLVQSAKMASIGSISAGLAHELNQPLGAIGLCAQLAKRLLGGDPLDTQKIMQKLDKIIKQVDRSSKIIKHLKVFSRHKGVLSEATDINWIIDESFVLVAASMKLNSVKVVTELADNLPKIPCDYIQIEQVLTNLISNARDALEGATEKLITIRSYLVNNTVCIDVEDNGCGMPNTVAEKVFDPFFTTKEVGKGMGMGMSISYGIVKEHKGELSVVSEEGQGSRFTLSLPA